MDPINEAYNEATRPINEGFRSIRISDVIIDAYPTLNNATMRIPGNSIEFKGTDIPQIIKGLEKAHKAIMLQSRFHED